jgi:hypothetical protein
MMTFWGCIQGEHDEILKKITQDEISHKNCVSQCGKRGHDFRTLEAAARRVPRHIRRGRGALQLPQQLPALQPGVSRKQFTNQIPASLFRIKNPVCVGR